MVKRSIPLDIVFSIITCGIYAFYWLYKLTESAHIAAGEETTAPSAQTVLFTVISFGVYQIYWLYRMGDTVNRARRNRGLTEDGNLPLIYLVVAMVAYPIGAYALLQKSLNELIDYDETGIVPLVP